MPSFGRIIGTFLSENKRLLKYKDLRYNPLVKCSTNLSIGGEDINGEGNYMHEDVSNILIDVKNNIGVWKDRFSLDVVGAMILAFPVYY